MTNTTTTPITASATTSTRRAPIRERLAGRMSVKLPDDLSVRGHDQPSTRQCRPRDGERALRDPAWGTGGRHKATPTPVWSSLAREQDVIDRVDDAIRGEYVGHEDLRVVDVVQPTRSRGARGLAVEHPDLRRGDHVGRITATVRRVVGQDVRRGRSDRG